MIDMSEVEMAAIREAFGTESRVLFCWFHVQQAIQRQFRQKISTQEGRLEARQDFNKIMYSNTQEEYEENKDQFIRRHQDNRGLIDYLNGQYFRGIAISTALNCYFHRPLNFDWPIFF